MAPPRRHYDVKRPLPKSDIHSANDQTHNITNLAATPVCVTATGTCSPLNNGSPGPITYITWSAPTNVIFDVNTFVYKPPTQNLRIPVDGFYDFWFMLSLGSGASGGFALHSVLETANTSDTGFASPVWSTTINGPSIYLRGSIDVPSGQRTWQILYRGCELHANDLARIGINMYDEPGGGTVADITGTTVPYSEFRFVYAIPNDAVVT